MGAIGEEVPGRGWRRRERVAILFHLKIHLKKKISTGMNKER